MDNHCVTLGGADWPREVDVLPGAHVAVLSEAVDLDGFFGRRGGLELRDTILVLSPHGTRFVLLFRKPVEEATIAEQVLKTGTGALNIDASRVMSDGSHFRKTVTGRTGGAVLGADERQGASLGMFQPGAEFEPTNHPGGRWPPNVLMVHGPGCKKLGTKRVKGTSLPANEEHTIVRRSGVHSEAKGHQTVGRVQPYRGHAEEDGLETVAAWNCQEDCPVRLLDEQTGELKNGGNVYRGYTEGGYHGGLGGTPTNFAGDSGGASRFFPQFKDDYELIAWLRRLIAP